MSETALPYRPFDHLREAWRESTPMARLQAVRQKAPYLRASILSDGPVLGVRTFDLITVPYPAGYGFSNGGEPASRICMHNIKALIETL